MQSVDLNQHDTICALATPPINSALAIIRVSGNDALAIKEKIFTPHRKIQKPFVATLGFVHFPIHHAKNAETIDEALCIAFPHEKSFTGQASFELNVHGGMWAVENTIEALLSAGCRLAAPGEFSFRAVLNGKIDLCGAEAINDLIAARSNQAAQTALRVMHGGLSKKINPVREIIIESLCEIESRLDFPDEDIGFAKIQEIIAHISSAIDALDKLAQGAQLGQRLNHQSRVVLYGKPNAGKSTLLNALKGEERALVHHLPGTTRDVLETHVVINDLPIKLVDVAGIREGDEIGEVEKLGIEKSLTEIKKADCVLWLHPHHEPHGEDRYLNELDAPVIKVSTKADLQNEKIPLSPPFSKGEIISAKTGLGLDNLRHTIRKTLVGNASTSEEVLLTKARQKEEVLLAIESLHNAKQCLAHNEHHELSAAELRIAGKALDRLLGTNLNEDVFDLIFSKFCIGK